MMKRTSLLVAVVLAVFWGYAAGAPKNIIVMISDGCGFNQVDAASLYQYGATGRQVYERFPTRVAMSTYMHEGEYDPAAVWRHFDAVKRGATDSAAAATVMSSGKKTYKGAIGVIAGPDHVIDEDDMTAKVLNVANVVEKSEAQGKATGVITSVEWTHATPAGFSAHSIHRDNYEAIGRQQIRKSACEVIMGCGHPWFDENGKARPEGKPNSFKYVGGEDTWNDLVAGTAGGDCDGDGQADPWTLVQTREEFQKLGSGETPKRVCGTAQVYQTLQQGRGGDAKAEPYAVPQIESVPTLAEMAQAAINVLDEDEDGFFLMIEGGAVDWCGHANQSGRLVEEEIDFNRAVEAVVDWVEKNSNWDETLLIVTADHETGYLTGPDSGQKDDGPAWNPLTNNGKEKQPGMQWHSGGHTNSLVPFYAKGDGAILFRMAAVRTDPVRGPYLDNTDLGRLLIELSN